MKHLVWILLLALLAACGRNSPPNVTFNYTVDPTVQPEPTSLPDGPQGPRPLAAAVDEKGLKSTFVINEVLFSPKSQSELQDFLNHYGGVILSNNTVPAPPPGSGIVLDPKYTQPTEYLVKIDPSKLDVSTFKADAEKAGLGGTFKISSDGGAKLLALVAHELAGGKGATANFVGQGDASGDTVMLGTNEGSGNDAFSWAEFGDTGSRANVVRAWQFVAARSVPRRPRVAIVDGGFWLDGAGNSLSADFPTTPLQYDFVDSDYNAGGTNPWTCGGGGCPWHGTGAASVALSVLNNGTGAAGTGGQVADPILFKTSADLYQVKHAVRAAIGWGADVISMSFTMCGNNAFCKIAFETTGFYNAFEDAGAAGLVMVAAAGNNGQNYEWAPCVLDKVICVGALANNSNTAISYSNYGSFVDIWAPTNIHAVYGNNPMGSLGLTTFGGTSASTPFIAGIAAMMRAYNPALTSNQVKNILQQTGYSNSPDPKVNYSVNAFAAVLQAAGNFLNPDRLEPNNTPAQATAPTPGNTYDLNLHNGADKDVYRVNAPGYSRVNFIFNYPDGLGKLALGNGLVKESGCGDTQLISDKTSANGRNLIVDIPPGNSLLTLSALARLPYNFFFTRQSFSLDPDALEPNETGNTAASIGQGSYSATLHVSNDVDYYRFTATASSSKPFIFNILSTDVPLTVRIFDGGNNEVFVGSTGPDCSSLPVYTFPSGTASYTVKVSASAGEVGKYAFGLGAFSPPIPPLITIFGSLNLWWINPGDPGIRFLKGVREGFIFERNVDIRSVQLGGEGLHLNLYNLSGNKVAEGQPFSTPGGGPEGERIDLSSLPAVQYVVEVLRTGEFTDGSVRLPLVPYNLQLGVGGP
ncbi:S8/S53 family peptidase [Meiothermus granaticius]|uniref:Thermophilic serine proteinase n=1 Tax=Meiothermus granaticius NBRC 107808 TaxID=1227551 RepID=A0A399F9R1_9DEIN|nr:S8/S53 family peptidase [Meiothermus granaticius]RIH92843.1 Thermophilic serine proteinase [Meiothermus granaticius NBRC 107808]GEM85557.1 hypothetical protein MGR01S_01820 [Meiothermus granaticius NBRC 107808]